MGKKSSSLLDAKKIRAKLASDRHRKQRRKHGSLDSLAGLDNMFQCIGRNAGRQREMKQQREIAQQREMERQGDMEGQSGIVRQQADLKPGCSIYQPAHKEMAAAGKEQEDSLRASLLSCLRGIDFKPLPREYSMTYCLYRGEARVAVFHDKHDVQLVGRILKKQSKQDEKWSVAVLEADAFWQEGQWRVSLLYDMTQAAGIMVAAIWDIEYQASISDILSKAYRRRYRLVEGKSIESIRDGRHRLYEQAIFTSDAWEFLEYARLQGLDFYDLLYKHLAACWSFAGSVSIRKLVASFADKYRLPAAYREFCTEIFRICRNQLEGELDYGKHIPPAGIPGETRRQFIRIYLKLGCSCEECMEKMLAVAAGNMRTNSYAAPKYEMGDEAASIAYSWLCVLGDAPEYTRQNLFLACSALNILQEYALQHPEGREFKWDMAWREFCCCSMREKLYSLADYFGRFQGNLYLEIGEFAFYFRCNPVQEYASGFSGFADGKIAAGASPVPVFYEALELKCMLDGGSSRWRSDNKQVSAMLEVNELAGLFAPQNQQEGQADEGRYVDAAEERAGESAHEPAGDDEKSLNGESLEIDTMPENGCEGGEATATGENGGDVAGCDGDEDQAMTDREASTVSQVSATGAASTARLVNAAGLFRGIQFDKNIFRNISPDQQQRFQKTFGDRLKKLERILKGGRRAAGNDFKLVRGCKGRKVLKRRVGSNRLSMVFKDGILTLLKLSSHDRQMVDIRKIKGRSVGYVYYELEDFLQQLAEWQPKNQGRQSFGEYMASPRHFVYDSDQQSIIESGERAENISVIGNAGAGKSVVGLKWLNDQLQKPDCSCLYLTMSENLVYTLDYEFRKGQDGKVIQSEAEISTTFDFLRRYLKAFYPAVPERSLLNSSQSLAVFRQFWEQEVDWRQFWHGKDVSRQYQNNETTLLAVWREIHGIIKGAVPLGLAYESMAEIGDYLPEEQYRELLRREKKDSVGSVLWVNTVYKTYEHYQRYLHRHKLLDDNDIARMLIRARETYSSRGRCKLLPEYSAVFLDECQDLTQMELLAIFHLLQKSLTKRMASDRCQMVQPTYFNEGWMRTASNDYDRFLGKDIDLYGCKARFLHYNYRSSKSIIDFQNYIIQYFMESDIMTLKQNEMAEIKVPPLTPAGVMPVWIKPGAENRRLLLDELCSKLDASVLQTIFAFDNSVGKADFPNADTAAVTDVISCKGMEYPSVLLYNLLTETRFDPVLAWKYFYVGATRGNRCIIIYEEAAADGSRIYDFLNMAAELGLIECCDNLLDIAPDGQQTWLGYLYQCVTESIVESNLETAEHALNFGQYELAYNIYAKDGKEPDMIAYCQGKAREMKKNFLGAIESYASISRSWSNKGRNRQNSVETLLKQPELEGADFLAAYVLSERYAVSREGQQENWLLAAQQAWEYKFGSLNRKAFYEALTDAVEMYPFMEEYISGWSRQMLGFFQRSAAAISTTLDRCNEQVN